MCIVFELRASRGSQRRLTIDTLTSAGVWFSTENAAGGGFLQLAAGFVLLNQAKNALCLRGINGLVVECGLITAIGPDIRVGEPA